MRRKSLILRIRNQKDGMQFHVKLLILKLKNLKIGMRILMEHGKPL